MKIDAKSIGVQDIVAIATIFGGLYLVSKGINGTIGSLLVLVVSFYFSRFRRDQERK